MELINDTRLIAGYSMGLEPSGRELLVVVIKGTFVLPKPGEEARLHEQQLPLVMADTFTGEPGYSAPVHEVDFAPRKPCCDVLLLGSARAPGGRPVTRMQVGIRVGSMTKVCEVVGDRMWEAGPSGIGASPPRPFTELPISYDVAFGGTDRNSENPADHDAYLPNPVGRGWHKHSKTSWIDGTPLPNTEEPGRVVKLPSDSCNPMAFGPLGRGWSSRARYAGTYDQKWLDAECPFLPANFDERYYQAAPVDQQLPHPGGPLEVALSGFTAEGLRHFTLPYFEAPVYVFPKRGEPEDYVATMDTVVFEPDHDRFTMSWRVSRPLKKSMHEIGQVVIGRKSELWWQEQTVKREGAMLAPVSD
jgi:hypothetical protein